jgi:hypothetical protein
MDKEQRQVIGSALIHLSVEHDAIWSGDIRAIRPQREELIEASLGVARNPLRYDSAFQFDAQRDPAGRQCCHAGNQPQRRSQSALRCHQMFSRLAWRYRRGTRLPIRVTIS